MACPIWRGHFDFCRTYGISLEALQEDFKDSRKRVSPKGNDLRIQKKLLIDRDIIIRVNFNRVEVVGVSVESLKANRLNLYFSCNGKNLKSQYSKHLPE